MKKRSVLTCVALLILTFKVGILITHPLNSREHINLSSLALSQRESVLKTAVLETHVTPTPSLHTHTCVISTAARSSRFHTNMHQSFPNNAERLSLKLQFHSKQMTRLLKLQRFPINL